MTPKIEDSTREQVAIFLPLAIQKAADSYRLFMEGDNDEKTSKNFAEHHKACKVAIAHLDLLLKLAHWANLPCDQAADALKNLEGMILESVQNNESAACLDHNAEDLA